MLRIRDVSPGSEFFSIQDSGSQIPFFSIPDPGSASKNLRILSQKWFLSSMIYDPGCSSRIRIPDPGFLPIPDPRSRCQKGTGSGIRDPGSWIRIRNTDFKIEIVTTLNTPCFTNLALNNTSVTTLYNRREKYVVFQHVQNAQSVGPLETSVVDPDPRPGAFLTSGSGIRDGK